MAEAKSAPPAGPAVDVRGVATDDPTKNVMALVEAANKRQDDLREQETKHRGEMDRLRNEAINNREELNRELRRAESARIDAIRAVDVGAVSRAAEVSAQQATTLAAQVATSAETLRGQVAAAATATATALATALEPILKRIEELSRVQYEQAGQKAQQTESKGTGQWVLGLVISVIFLALSIAGFAISIAAR